MRQQGTSDGGARDLTATHQNVTVLIQVMGRPWRWRYEAGSMGLERDVPMLQIDPRKVCYLIIKAREFDAKVAVIEPDPGSNPSDDDMRGVLEDYPDDPVVAEIRTLVDSLNEDEQIDLVTLLWLGRSDGSADEWDALREEAAAAHNEYTSDYLLGTPLLGDYLSEGLGRLGYDCGDVEREHL